MFILEEDEPLPQPRRSADELAGVAVRCTGIDLSEEEQRALENEVRQALADDSDDLPAAEKDGLQVCVDTLGISGVRAARAEGQVRAATFGVLGRRLGAADTAAICVCAGNYPGDVIDFSAFFASTTATFGTPIPWRPVWRGPSPGVNTWVIAVKLDTPGWNWARLVLADGAPAGIGLTTVRAGLANTTPWAKEMVTWNLCRGRGLAAYQGGTNATPAVIQFDTAQCNSGANTLTFHKPGFLGFWHPVGHFDDGFFWSVFGGTIATFTWVID